MCNKIIDAIINTAKSYIISGHLTFLFSSVLSFYITPCCSAYSIFQHDGIRLQVFRKTSQIPLQSLPGLDLLPILLPACLQPDCSPTPLHTFRTGYMQLQQQKGIVSFFFFSSVRSLYFSILPLISFSRFFQYFQALKNP